MSHTRPWILGLSNKVHNGAACLVHGNEIVVAMQEERLIRVKRAPLDYNYSFLCVDYCLKAAGIQPSDLELVVECRIMPDPKHSYLGSRLHARLGNVSFLNLSHHLSHAWSCAAPSGFEETTVLVIDGGGSIGTELHGAEREAAFDWSSDAFEHLSLYHYHQGRLTVIEKHLSPMPYLKNLTQGEMPEFASLGHMFSSVAFLAFEDYMEADKVMGLAPYGRPVHQPSEWFSIESRHFVFPNSLPKRYISYAPWPAHQREFADLAASAQASLEHALQEVVGRVLELGLPRRLTYAGGVALNSVANHRVLSGRFEDLFILPAAEDSGTAIGAALYGLSQIAPKRSRSRFKSDFLGHSNYDEYIERGLARLPGIEEIRSADILDKIVDLLTEGRIVGWFEGGAEFGPRALGHRSILCDARRTDAKDVLNRRVKHREAFRPFAPVILKEHVREWFEISEPSRLMDFMLEVCEFKSHVRFTAVVHVDGTGRLQTVTRESQPTLHDLLSRFNARTGVPMLINTSFNIMGEPIVETPRDALWGLLFTGIDDLYINGRLFTKASTYRGVLSLVPKKQCRVLERTGKKYLRCETEHGSHIYLVDDPQAFVLLEHMDGKCSMGEIARRVLGEGTQEEALAIWWLRWLMRRSAVGLAL